MAPERPGEEPGEKVGSWEDLAGTEMCSREPKFPSSHTDQDSSALKGEK